MNSIFVSSTFRDMNFERDILNRRIAPKINHQLRQYNQSVRILDLRWGVDTSDLTEQEASDRVLSVCMHAIDSCKPYFVVLVGDRYGYIPPDCDISVTHMEILRGALERTDKAHIYIYFRDTDYTGMPDEFRDVYMEKNEESRSRLKQLADRLLREMPQCCRRYAAKWSAKEQCLVSEDFEDLILKDLEGDLVKEYRGVSFQSELHRQLYENEETLLQNQSYAHFDKARLDAYAAGILHANRPKALIDAGGAGKSVYMSLLCSALRTAGEKAYILFCGDSVFAASVRNAAETVLYALMDGAGKAYDFAGFCAMPYSELIDHIMKVRDTVTGKVYLFLDAVDKCDRGMMEFAVWCSRFLADQVQLVISSRDTQEIQANKESLQISRLEYTTEDYRKIADRILEKYGKQLNPACVDLALKKIQTPLQLRLLLMRLMRLDAGDFALIQSSGGNMEQINAYLQRLIEESPAETEGLISVYLQELLKDSEKPGFCLFLLNLLAICEYGLPEDDVRALFELADQKWTELEYVDFLERFAFFIRIRENGKLDLSHDIIRQTLRLVFRKSKRYICSLLSAYLLAREPQDSLSIRSFFDVAFLGKQPEAVVAFAKKNKGSLSSLEENALGTEIRNSVRHLFFKDGGAFLVKTAATCGSAEDLFAFYTMLSSALMTIDDYLEEEQALQIVCVVTDIAFRLFKGTGNELLRLAVDECHSFLENNNVSREKTEQFLRFCHEEINGKEGKGVPVEDRTPDALLAQLHRTGDDDRAVLWAKLFEIAKQMASDAEQAGSAERILKELLPIAQSGQLRYDGDMTQALLGELHSCFGAVYKSLRRWEESLEHDRISRDIYKKIYEKTPSQDVFRKYCNKVYNIANVTEAWAMTEKNDPALWEKTRQAYEAAYAMEATLLASETSQRRITKAASIILGLGTALINTGKHEEGMKTYTEGISLILNSAKNHDDVNLYAELCLHLFECTYQLVQCKKLTAAYELSRDIAPHLSRIIRSGEKAVIAKVKDYCDAFFKQMNQTLSQLLKKEDAQDHLVVARMVGELYEIVLPIASAQYKINLIITKCNMCSIVMFALQDYDLAYREYKHLLELTVREELIVPDKNGKYPDAVTARLVDAYSRILICLDKLERHDEAEEWIHEAERWAEYFAERMETNRADIPKVLFDIFSSLQRNDCAAGIVFLMMAFRAIQKEDYDQKAHPKTVMRILAAVEQLNDSGKL